MFEEMATHDSIQRTHSCILTGHFPNNAGVLFNSDSVSVRSPVLLIVSLTLVSYFALLEAEVHVQTTIIKNKR